MNKTISLAVFRCPPVADGGTAAVDIFFFLHL